MMVVGSLLLLSFNVFASECKVSYKSSRYNISVDGQNIVEALPELGEVLESLDELVSTGVCSAPVARKLCMASFSFNTRLFNISVDGKNISGNSSLAVHTLALDQVEQAGMCIRQD